MTGTGELFDSNILIDALNGHPEASEALLSGDSPAISFVTWMEVLAGADEKDAPAVRAFLMRFARIELSEEIMEAGVKLRRVSRLKLLDAIILATAQVSGRVLVTRNTRDFGAGDAGIWVPYRL